MPRDCRSKFHSDHLLINSTYQIRERMRVMKPDKKPTGWGGTPVPQPDISEIQTAAERLKDVIVRTPLVPLYSSDSKVDIFLKPELLQPIGSFKIRGVYNWAASLPAEKREHGLSTISGGNTALALGYVSRLFGVPAQSLLPDSVPDSRVEAIESYGANAIKVLTEDLFKYIFESRWKQETFNFLNPWGDSKMIAGSGTIGLEIFGPVRRI